MSRIYSIPFNGDLGLIESLNWNKIYEVYGAPTDTQVYHGRSRRGLQHSLLTTDHIRLAKVCEQHGTYFNLVLNSPYYPPEFFHDNSPLDDLIKQFSNLPNIKFTITIPQVIDKIKQWVKTPAIKVSKFANIDSVDKVLRWKRFDIESFVLPADITKKTDEIKNLCELGVKVAILVNDPCIKGCPMSNYHFTNSSLHSVDSKEEGYNDYCISYCKNLMLKNPFEILRSSFVRPEDVDFYKNLGVKYFKLVDRNKPTRWIQRAINSYINQKHSGNLLELFPLFYSETLDSSFNLFIENSRLEGLIERQSNNCSEEICQNKCFKCNELIDFV